MKTNELITLLANGSAAVDPAGGRRLALALGWGMAGTILLMALLLGVRADLAQAARLPMFWAKILVPLTAAAAALQLARRLSIPGMRVATAPFVLGALLLLALSGATVALAAAAPDGRVALIFGSTWKTCALCITMLSLPLLVAALWAIKGLAPTRPVLAGGAAGLLAGTGAAAVYALHCPEMAAPFLGTWYVLGVAIPSAIGAVLGKRLLHW